jgi:hypothetical protein
MLIRITTPHFVAGLDTETRVCAPIIAYMRLWTIAGIRSYCEKKGWMFEMVKGEGNDTRTD